MVSSPPVKFTPASSRSCSRQPQLDSMSALARGRGSGQPHGRLRRVGCHQAEAAAASFDFSATIFDFSAATDEAPHEDSVVRAPAAHRECEKYSRARKLLRWWRPTPSDRTRSLLRDFRVFRSMSLRHRAAAEVRRRVRHLPGRIFEPDLLLHDRARPPDHPGSKSGELKNRP